MPKDSGIGARTNLVEDQRLLTGKGLYSSDINFVNQTYALFLRSDAGGSDLPFDTVDHSCNTPCTHIPLGVKGCGEAWAIGSPPMIVNAIINALHSGGHTHVMHIDMPVSLARVSAAINTQ